MENPVRFRLNITMRNGTRDSETILNLYTNIIADEIDMIAWNLNNCDDNVQAVKFGNLALDEAKVIHTQDGDFQLESVFSVVTDNPVFINLLIETYMDGFAYSIQQVVNGYYSRVGKRPQIDPNPVVWDLKFISVGEDKGS